MKSAKKQARPSKTPKQNLPGKKSFLKKEAFLLLFLFLGLFLALGLFSYHPHDPSFSGYSTYDKIQNWGGIVGAYLADFLLQTIGVGAFVLVGFWLFVGGLHLVFIKRSFSVAKELPLLFLATLTLTLFSHIYWPTFSLNSASLVTGGLIGKSLAKVGLTYLGMVGLHLLLAVFLVFSFLLLTGISLRISTWVLVRKIFQGLGKTTQLAFGQSQRLIRVFFVKLKKAFSFLKFSQKTKTQKVANSISVNQPSKSAAPLSTVPEIENSVSHFKKSIDTYKNQEPKIFDRKDTQEKQKVPEQLEFQNLSSDYQLPPLSLLDSEESGAKVVLDQETLKMNAKLLERKLLDFQVQGKVTEIHPGPVITMYEFAPAPGVKLSKISNLVDDLSLAMEGRSVRIVAPLPNKAAVGIEIPNNVRETVWLKDIIADERFRKHDSKLLFAFGKDIEGIPYVSDLAKMPHLLVAGATGSGKSVSVNSMILSILYRARPDQVRLIMVDPKMLELSIYEGIPHLLLPVVTQPKKASLALKWAVSEMERRYRLLADINARNIVNYNKKIESGDFVSKQAENLKKTPDVILSEDQKLKHEEKMPYLVIIIDELADLMMVSSKEVEESITRLAQMARASGIHLILATQRPSVDVITGVIKANFPSRISFRVSSKHDSRTILDGIGAERLLGSGDMLFVPPGTSKQVRVHGAFISEGEVGRVVEFLKKQAKPVYDESILQVPENQSDGLDGDEEHDELYDQAVAIVAETRQASISMLQRKLRVGYNRSARMIEQMEKEGIVSSPSHQGQRQVLVSSTEPAS